MFTAYFDVSGHPADQKAVTAAGLVADNIQWEHFERNWEDDLKDFNIKAFHTTDYMNSKREYESWKGNEKRRKDFLCRLIGHIRRRVLYSFAIAIWMDDFKEIDRLYTLRENDLTPYSLACGASNIALRIWARGRGTPVSQLKLIFEKGDADQGSLIRLCNKYPTKLIRPALADKRTSHAFEAADLLAYEHFKANQELIKINPEKVSQEKLPSPFLLLSEIAGGGDNDNPGWRFYQYDDLMQLCDSLGIPKR